MRSAVDSPHLISVLVLEGHPTRRPGDRTTKKRPLTPVIRHDPGSPHLQQPRYAQRLSHSLSYLTFLRSAGKPRLSKFYTPVTSHEQSALLAQIFQLVSDRPAGLCNFLDAPGLVFPGGKGRGSAGKGKGKGKVNDLRRRGDEAGDDEGEDDDEDELRVIYRHYATLYFV